MRVLRPFAVAVALALVALRAGADESVAPYSVRDTIAASVAVARAKASFAAGELARGATEAQAVLDGLRDDLVTEPSGDLPQVRYVPAAEAAVRLLLSLPDDARAVYAETVGPAARALLDRAVTERDERRLREVLARFGAAPEGVRAGRLLAESALEAGRPLDAAATAREALRYAPACPLLWTTRIDALAAARDGAALAALAPPREALDATVAVAGASVRVGDRLAAARAAVPPPGGPTDVPMWDGSPAHDVRAPWDHVLRPLRWQAGSVVASRRNDVPQNTFGMMSTDTQGPFDQRRLFAAPLAPILVGRTLVVADGVAVEGRELLSGRLAWRFPAPGRRVPGLDVFRGDVDNLPGRTNLDVVHAPCAADGRVYATVEVADPTFVPRRLHGVEITTYRPKRVLVALDATTGELAWRMGADPADAATLLGWSIGSAPVVADGVVVAVGVRFQSRWQARLLAFDAATGRLRWSLDVVTSQQELNLFGEPIKELWAGTPAVADGTVYAPTGLGIFVAADLRTGDVRWMSSYETIVIERVELWYSTPLRLARWGPAPTVVHGDVVLAAPADGPHLLCFGRADGRLRWREEAQAPRDGATAFVDHFLGVVHDGKRDVAVVTGRSLRALDLADGRVVWGARFSEAATVRGRGTVSRTRVYVPTTAGLDVFSLAGEGRLLAPSPMPWPDRGQPGNVLLTPRVVVVAGGVGPEDDEGRVRPVQAYFDPEDIEREIAERRRARPDDPGPALELADLFRLVGAESRAAAAYEVAREVARRATDEAAADRAREGLLLLARDRGDAAAGLGKASDARAAYESALALARTAAERVAVRVRLDRLFRDAGLENARVRNLVALTGEAGDEKAALSPREGEVPARAGARFLLAEIHAGAGRAVDAVDVLQEVLREDGDVVVGDEVAALRAKRRIDTIVAEAGPSAYARHEADAARRLAEAAAGTDPAPFQRILAEFPNARAVPDALLGLAERQAGAGDDAAAAATLKRFLTSYPDHPATPRALARLSRTLAATGAREPARAILATLERRHALASFELDGTTFTGRSFAEAELARLGTPPPPPPPSPLSRRPTEKMTETVDGQGVGARCVEIESAGASSVRLPALVQVDDELVAIDPADGRVRWRRTVGGQAQATAAGDVLVVAAGDTALGLEPETGEPIWREDLPATAIDAGTTLGQAVLLVQYASVVARSAVVAIDPVTGRRAWSRDLVGDPVTRMVVAEEGVVVVRARVGATSGFSVSVLSSLTGEPVGDLPRTFDPTTEGSPRVVDGRTVVGLVRDGDGLALAGWDLGTLRPRFSTAVPVARQGFLQRHLLVRGDRMVLVEATGAVRTYALDDGSAVAETAVTGGLTQASPRCLVLRDDRVVALLRLGRDRCVVVAFDRTTGRALWTKDALRGVNQGMLLDGGDVIVAVLSPVPVRSAGTLAQPPEYQILVLDPADGREVRISAAGLGDFVPSATLVDGALVVAGRRRFALFR
ncbi:MAG: PQQ-binding-like beta-propeller repeat protein [Planctomycetes bacterium]|nr:PQQ-binding-like beta-propeller repeat protein [Planctomycetota bacterium]